MSAPKTEPRFCRACKWSVPNELNEDELLCTQPFVMAQDIECLADADYAYACKRERQRRYFTPCGRRAKLWEPKP